MPNALSEKEAEYTKRAIQNGVARNEVVLILLIARFCEKDPVDVQTAFTELKVGYNQTVSEWGSKIEEEARQGLGFTQEYPKGQE
jgi:hypothetical protein